MGNGNLHRHTDLPCLLAGKLGGQFKTGRHMAYPENTPMANLLVTILDKAGVHTEKLGDSTGPLRPDYLSYRIGSDASHETCSSVLHFFDSGCADGGRRGHL